MIPDWETNRLFVSDRLEQELPDLFSDLRSIFGSTLDVIPNTNDIWCRDFMPVQLDEHRFCQFEYRPGYLAGFDDLATPPDNCRLQFMEDCQHEGIVLDGGNVVASRTRVILTEKIYKRNPAIERPRLRQRLEEIFEAECLIVPREPYDEVGHSDGVVRFIAENRILISDYAEVDPDYGVRLRRSLEQAELEIETLPLFCEDKTGPDGVPSAVGNYVNFLRVGNTVALPAYNRREDELALQTLVNALPEADVRPVPCRSLAERGGVLHCISWTIRTPL